MYDIIIKNGKIVDGSANASFFADVALLDGKIAAIEPCLDSAQARQVVDAQNHVVAPGFIDIHSHSDTYFLRDDRGESRIFQGVTTEVVGQCGSSIFPCPAENIERLQKFAEPQISEYASCSLEEFLFKVQRDNKKMGTNLAPLVGHGALRCGVMGYENRKASPQELKKMQELLEYDMRSGAWGLSLGLGYTPGVSSDSEELCALGEVVAKHGGTVTSHMRNQGIDTPKSLEEMYDIYRKSGAHVHISHFKASGMAAWGRGMEFIDNVHQAQRNGINVSVDIYPYLAASSDITNSFPKWAIQGGKQVAVEGLKDKAVRSKIIQELEKSFGTQIQGEGLYVVETKGKCPVADGKNIWQLSCELGISMAEAVAKVTVETDAGATCIAFAMCEEDVNAMLSQNDFAIGSDGYSLPMSAKENIGKPHPRNFGTFPRFLRLARESEICSLEMAVHRITGMSAKIMGIQDRGLIEVGMAADITIFDAETIADRATYENPFQKCIGVRDVIINGEIAMQNEIQTEKRLGKFLLKNK